VDLHGPPRLAPSPAKTSVNTKAKKPSTIAVDSPGSESCIDVESSSPVPQPRVTRARSQKKGSAQSNIEKKSSRAPQRPKISPETIQTTSESDYEDAPEVDSHSTGTPARKRRAGITDSDDSEGDNTPIVAQHRRPAAKKAKPAVYVSSSEDSQEKRSGATKGGKKSVKIAVDDQPSGRYCDCISENTANSME
jgi:hypothetical protein